MLYLLDTNVLSEILRENKKLDARLAALTAADRAVICTIVRGEVLFGIARMAPGRRRNDLQRKTENLLASFSCEVISEAVAEQYAAIK